MSKITVRMHVDATPDVVFAIASDFENAAENIAAIEQLELLSDGPVGVGTRFRETRKMFGKEATEEMEITTFEGPHGYVVESDSCGAHFRAEYKFVGDIAGTHVRLEVDCRPVTLMAKLMSPLSALMMGTMKKLFVADLEDVKRIAEAQKRKTKEREE